MRNRARSRSVNRLWIVLELLYACGDNVRPIERPPAPQVSSAGGPVLVGPEIVPIFFAGDDDMQHQLEAFLDQLATSAYWRTATSEYGIGAPTIDASIVAIETPPTTDGELQALLESHVGSRSWRRRRLAFRFDGRRRMRTPSTSCSCQRA